MERIFEMIKRITMPLFSLKNRKPKPSQAPKILAAQANVLAYAFHQGYDTHPPSGYAATIALVRVTDSTGLCYTLEKMGWSLYYYGGDNNSVDRILLDATDEFLVAGMEIDYVGLISKYGQHNLSQAGISMCSYALPSDDNQMIENHSRLEEILPLMEVKE